jgi:hypothetical protein
MAVVLQVDVYPFGIKQHPGERVDEPLRFMVVEGVPPSVQFPCRLSQHLKLRQEAQMFFPDSCMGVQRYLICPSLRSGFEFEDRPFSSGEGDRVVKLACMQPCMPAVHACRACLPCMLPCYA